MTRISDLTKYDAFTKEQYIRLLYEVILQRPPSQSAFDGWMARQDIEKFFTEFISHADFRQAAGNNYYMPGFQLGPQERPRVLLLGAYGNGNLGDKVQAISLSRSIRRIRPDADIWAGSALNAVYPFAYDKILPGHAINKPSVINTFDMLLVGGGGLLSHPHDPFTSQAWQEEITLPVAFVGIGAALDVAKKSEILLKKAFSVSVRDDHSMGSVRQIIDHAIYASDPVLCDPHYDSSALSRRGAMRTGTKRLWILKYTSDEEVSSYQEKINLNSDEICFLEPALDFPLVKYFPRARAIYRTEDLMPLIDNSGVVISMRYHGCIFSILRNKPTIGVKEHKIMDLFKKYGNEQYFIKDIKSVEFDMSKYKAPLEMLRDDRNQFDALLRGALSRIKKSPRTREDVFDTLL